MHNIAIVGYGNLGRGVELSLANNSDLNLVGIFTRREPSTVETISGKVFSMDDLLKKKNEIDVCILCGGSATDLPKQTPKLTKYFNTVDSFDTHALIPEHFENVDQVAKESGHVSIISVGWDPGVFSLNRIMAEAILPKGKTITFWGKGVSQGHSDAIRRIEGVRDGIQYTIPNQEKIDAFKKGEVTELTTREKHTRECFVVLDGQADAERVKEEIITMPNYFSDYETTVHFVTQDVLEKDHKQGMPHGGKVIRVGHTSEVNQETIEYTLELDSNPEFTASVLVAYARACARLSEEGKVGALTVFDIAPKYIINEENRTLRKNSL